MTTIIPQNSNTSTKVDTSLNRTSHLDPHIQEIIAKRNIPEVWAVANCIPADESLTGIMLNMKGSAPSGSIVFISADLGQVQIRPYDPWGKEGEEPPKYRSPFGRPYDIYFPHYPDNRNFWKDLEAVKTLCIHMKGKKYIVLTEGAFKAITGCLHGIPTVALTGVTTGLTPKSQGEPDLVPGLKRLALAGFNFIIAFDSDTKPNTVKNVGRAEKCLTERLKAYGCDVLSATGKWSADEGKGMDDFINNKGIEEFRAILMKAESKVESSKPAVESGSSKSKNKRLLDLIETHWGERLRLNEMTQQVELNGKADLDIERVYLRLADELGIDIPKQTASDLVVVTAQKYAYSPVRDYLNSLSGVEPIDLDNLAKRYFGTNDPLHAILFKRTLIAAVARAFEPGCKVDTVFILQGDQGIEKSTFFEVLAGKPWFTDNLSEGNEKDEKLKLRRYWMLEFSEFETAYKRKEISQLKAFLTSRVDSLRPPYGRCIEDFPRTSVFVGSTNGQEFLHDPTGERRYWVVRATQKIPTKTVEAERDRIWGAAVAAYRAGEQWWLTPEEDKLLAEANKGWQSSDTWEADILKYIEFRSTCTVGDILEKAIGMDLAQQKKAEQMRVSEILCRNGWSRVTKRVDGKLQKCWERQVVTGGNGVVTEVVTPQNSLYDSTLDTLLPPVTTFSPKHPSEISSAVETAKNSNSEIQESFENIGGNTSPSSPQNPVGQGSQPVTTSKQQGGNTLLNPSELETIAKKYQAEELADEYKEACADGNDEIAEKILKEVSDSKDLQFSGFFKRHLAATSAMPTSSIVGSKHKTFEKDDRVVVKDVGGRYAGTKGTILKVLNNQEYEVVYDKAVAYSQFGNWPASELMKL